MKKSVLDINEHHLEWNILEIVELYYPESNFSESETIILGFGIKVLKLYLENEDEGNTTGDIYMYSNIPDNYELSYSEQEKIDDYEFNKGYLTFKEKVYFSDNNTWDNYIKIVKQKYDYSFVESISEVFFMARGILKKNYSLYLEGESLGLNMEDFIGDVTIDKILRSISDNEIKRRYYFYTLEMLNHSYSKEEREQYEDEIANSECNIIREAQIINIKFNLKISDDEERRYIKNLKNK